MVAKCLISFLTFTTVKNVTFVQMRWFKGNIGAKFQNVKLFFRQFVRRKEFCKEQKNSF